MDYTVEGSDVISGMLNQEWNKGLGSVAEILVGTKCTRHGCVKDGGTVEALCDYYMRLGVPIPLVTMWGSMKGYGHWHQGLDMMDVFAIKRYTDVMAAVQQHYPPGIKVTIVVEDHTRFLKTGYKPDYVYPFSLQQFTKRWPWIKWTMESKLIDDVTGFNSQVRKNMRALTEAHQHNRWEPLEALGWRGRPNWEHYVQRARTEMPFEGEHQLFMRVCHYFAISLARYQFQVVPEGIKASFAAYPCGTDLGMYKGRVEWKAKPSRTSKRMDVPWLAWMTEAGQVIGLRERREGTYTSHLLSVNDEPVTVLSPI